MSRSIGQAQFPHPVEHLPQDARSRRTDEPRPSDRCAQPPVVGRLRAAGCVFAEDEARLLTDAARDPAELDAMVRRRIGGEPLEYILGWAEFCGLRIVVEPGVFVPRRRTALLVRAAAALLRPGTVAVDLCCGSGAVGAALVRAVPGIEVHAVDVHPGAVRCARRNLPAARVHEGDLDAPLPAILRGRVDVLVANAPYVPTDAIVTMPPEARDHEPQVALDGGTDGLDVARRIIAVAPRWLVPGGHLIIETSRRQAPLLVDAYVRHGFTARMARNDELDATAVIGVYG